MKEMQEVDEAPRSPTNLSKPALSGISMSSPKGVANKRPTLLLSITKNAD